MPERRRRRHLVTIERVTENQDSFGEPVKSWEMLADAYADIRPMRGREFFDAQQVQSEANVMMNIRLDTAVAITAKDRVVFGSRTFDIVAPPINIDELNREYDLICKERF